MTQSPSEPTSTTAEAKRRRRKSKRPDRLPQVKAFVAEHGYSALTGSDAFWLIEDVERLQAELVAARAQIAAMQAVVEAQERLLRAYRLGSHHIAGHAIDDLRKAKDALAALSSAEDAGARETEGIEVMKRLPEAKGSREPINWGVPLNWQDAGTTGAGEQGQ